MSGPHQIGVTFDSETCLINCCLNESKLTGQLCCLVSCRWKAREMAFLRFQGKPRPEGRVSPPRGATLWPRSRAQHGGQQAPPRRRVSALRVLVRCATCQGPAAQLLSLWRQQPECGARPCRRGVASESSAGPRGGAASPGLTGRAGAWTGCCDWRKVPHLAASVQHRRRGSVQCAVQEAPGTWGGGQRPVRPAHLVYRCLWRPGSPGAGAPPGGSLGLAAECRVRRQGWEASPLLPHTDPPCSEAFQSWLERGCGGGSRTPTIRIILRSCSLPKTEHLPNCGFIRSQSKTRAGAARVCGLPPWWQVPLWGGARILQFFRTARSQRRLQPRQMWAPCPRCSW